MRTIFILAVVLGLWGAGKAPAQGVTLTVNVSHMRSDSGKLYLSLYRTAEGYPKNPAAAYRLAFCDISHGKAAIVLDKIPPGIYAIACYHDENNNGKMDSNFFGKPTEGTGASNDARGHFGPPKFSNAEFRLQRDTAIGIIIHY